jgi:hypothetical protein
MLLLSLAMLKSWGSEECVVKKFFFLITLLDPNQDHGEPLHCRFMQNRILMEKTAISDTKFI